MTRTGPTTTSAPPTARRRRSLPLVAAFFVLLAAGCSTQAENADTDQHDGASTGSAIDFSQCMRDNGVPDFPDPDASGRLTIDAIANNTNIDTGSATFEQALTACRDLQPAGFTGYRRTDDQQAAALAFAQCVRDNGLTDFPDPGPGDPLVDTTRIPSANQPGGMDRLDTALDGCDHLMGDAGLTP
ncbi:hypothetical protein [Microbacterium sp. No. 7]|uniref:hypothetical protein n=1 Tax=Microbacterium sp. No. 7 TaxID=1714373 RepID=UPI000ACDDCBD|nr:hypothetical protein [Microbacterium sp. No. 7]